MVRIFPLAGLILATTTTQALASPAVPIWSAQSRSCSAASFANATSFLLNEYRIETTNTEVEQGLVGGTTRTLATFSVVNPGTGDTYRLHRIPIQAGGGTWSVCRPGETPIPSTLERCQYLLERRRGGRVGFRFQWLCDGKDPNKPYVPSLPYHSNSWCWASNALLTELVANPGGEKNTSLLFDSTMIGDLPNEVCAAANGTDGVTQACGLDVDQVVLPIANIYWEEVEL